MLLTSCASIQPQVPYDPTDTCEQYREPLRQAEEEQRKNRERWVAAGVIGAVGGFLLCQAIRKDDNKKPCIAAAALIFLGTMGAGYMQEKSQQAANKASLLSGIDSDSAAFNRKIGSLGSAANRLNQCRMKQIASVKKQYRNKNIDRQVALNELAHIETKLTEDQQLINALLDETDQRADLQVKAMAAAKGLPPEEYFPGYSTTASRDDRPKQHRPDNPPRPHIKPKDTTQRTYNAAVDLRQKTQMNQAETQRLLAQTKELFS